MKLLSSNPSTWGGGRRRKRGISTVPIIDWEEMRMKQHSMCKMLARTVHCT
jgi:hypothetical protein